MKFIYAVITDECPHKGMIIRNYGGNIEVFDGNEWKDFSMLEDGLDDSHTSKTISEDEAEKIVGEKFHDGEEERKKIFHDAQEKFGHMTTEEFIRYYHEHIEK